MQCLCLTLLILRQGYSGKTMSVLRLLIPPIFVSVFISCHGPLARYVKLRVTHAPGMPGTFSPPPPVSDPDMHHDTCLTHVPCCMPGSLTSGFLWSRWRENVPGISGSCTTRKFTYLERGIWHYLCGIRISSCYFRVNLHDLPHSNDSVTWKWKFMFSNIDLFFY